MNTGYENYFEGWQLETRTKYVTIASDQRDINIYPNPNHYSIKLDVPIRNVHSVFVLRSIIPKGEYVVNNNNNVLKLTINGTLHTINIPIQEYDIITYTDELNVLLNPLNINVIFNSLTSKLEITSSMVYNVEFLFNEEKSPYFEMGFDKKIITWNSQFTLYSTNRVDLFGTQEIKIKMHELTENDDILEHVVHNINLSLIDSHHNNPIVRFVEPHREFNRITLTFINSRYGTLYNFNGVNNTIILGFNYYKYRSPTILPELKYN